MTSTETAADVAEALQPPPPHQLVAVPPPVARPTGAVFGGLSRLRGRRAMHPVGVVRTATLAVPAATSLPAPWRALDGAQGIVRFSKSVGFPGRVPDILGIALRFGEQDLLLASAGGDAPVLQHLLVPTTGFDRRLFSSLLLHHVGEGLAVIRARIEQPLPEAATSLDAVRLPTSISIELTAAGVRGTARPLGTVLVGAVIEEEAAKQVRFDAWRAGGGLRPAGPLQRMRAAAYAASRRATRT